MKILYSYAKSGFESKYWEKEISAASTDCFSFIPFNHSSYIPFEDVWRAQLLDNLYYNNDVRLIRLYKDIVDLIEKESIDILIVDTYSLYHPEFLMDIKVHKVLRIADGPLSSYDRDFAYIHAFDQVLYHSPAYNRKLTMHQKLKYCGAKNISFWPLASFDALCDRNISKDGLFSKERDIDVVFVGAMHLNKMPLLANVKKHFKKNMRLYGLCSIKKNFYFNLRYRFPGWVRPLKFDQYIPLYQRSKIGINLHNRGKYTVGGYRLFDLPANGVMQISDGGEYLEEFFRVGIEIESYDTEEELIDKVRFYLKNDRKREKIATAGYQRVLNDYTIKEQLKRCVDIVKPN